MLRWLEIAETSWSKLEVKVCLGLNPEVWGFGTCFSWRLGSPGALPICMLQDLCDPSDPAPPWGAIGQLPCYRNTPQMKGIPDARGAGLDD